MHGVHRAVIFHYFGRYDNQNLAIYQVVAELKNGGEMTTFDAVRNYMAKVGDEDCEYVYYDDSAIDGEEYRNDPPTVKWVVTEEAQISESSGYPDDSG